MDVHGWNRKDLLPDESISKFTAILNSIGIEICTVQQEKYRDLWYSNRIEIKGLNTVGTNGKGVSPEYTQASALGEFFERLQNGMLVNYLFPINRKNHKIFYDGVDYIAGFAKFFPAVWNALDPIHREEMITKNALSGGCCVAEDLFTSEKDVLPENLVSVLCGANGTSAGNTFAEAFVQGMSEIFERYVVQFIYKEEYTDLFKTVDDIIISNLNSYQLIQAIRDRRYHVRVIDCSLGGKLPVVGIMIMDPTMTKYVFKLGADSNADIALQRCITEVFQGSSFDLNFRMNMNDLFVADMNEDGFWFGSNRPYEHIRAEIDGSGKLPLGFFKSIEKTTDKLLGFCNNLTTNGEAVKYMLSCSKHISDSISIVNYTKYGIPCIRILMPNACASLYYPTNLGSNLIDVMNSIRSVRDALITGSLMTREVLDHMICILNYPAYTYDFSMTKILGVITDNIDVDAYLYNPYLFTAYLALFLKEYNTAVKYIEIYNENARISDVIKRIDRLVIKGLKEGVQDKEIMNLIICGVNSTMTIEEVEKLVNIHDHGLKVPVCPDCELCEFNQRCCYKTWKRIEESLSVVKLETLDDEFEKFLLECRCKESLDK